MSKGKNNDEELYFNKSVQSLPDMLTLSPKMLGKYCQGRVKKFKKQKVYSMT